MESIGQERKHKNGAIAKVDVIAEAKAAAEEAAIKEHVLMKKRVAKEAAISKQEKFKEEFSEKEQKVLDSICGKRKKIEMLEKVIVNFEKEREDLETQQVITKDSKREKEMERYKTRAQRLTDRIDQYSNHLKLINEQLWLLEDTGFYLHYIQDMYEAQVTVKVQEEEKARVEAAKAKEYALKKKREAEENELLKKQEMEDEQRIKEKMIFEEIAEKKKQIMRVEKIIEHCEKEIEETEKELLIAHEEKKLTEITKLAIQAKRLKDRNAKYCHHLTLCRDQLFALEDAGLNFVYFREMKETTNVLNEINIDPEEVNRLLSGLKDRKELLDGIKAAVVGEEEDTDDLLEQLEEFCNQLGTGKEPVDCCTDVPSLRDAKVDNITESS